MRCKNPTPISTTGILILAALLPASAVAQVILEEIIVTATRRAERIQDVPISVTPLSGERFDALFESGEDIRALATRIPSLYAESSNGRVAPRFYIRGLGNTDFDLAASQPVSVIFDEVVQENVILKSFPLFDIQQVEVLRGPQGTLFGRNTPAGIVKFDTVKPRQEYDADVSLSYGTHDTAILQGAMGGGLVDDVLAGRVSFLYQDQSDWIDNGFTGESDAMGGFEEFAARAQLLYTPTPTLDLLFNVHARSYEGTASIFRANIMGPGNNSLNQNFDRETVYFNEGDNNPQEYDGLGGSLRIDYDITDTVTITSITAHEQTDGFSLGDIDGGVVDFSNSATVPPGITFDPAAPVFFAIPTLTFPGTIIIPSVTRDGIDNLDQFTQEIRIASQGDAAFTWQGGFFYFDSEFAITTFPFFIPPTTVIHENTSWAVFGQGSYDLNEQWTITAGLRWTDDEKDLTSAGVAPVNVKDDELSWDLSAMYAVNDDLNLFGRVARGFRAPTIQGRDIAFGAPPSTAKSETILSFEAGFKAELANDRIRLNGSVFQYTIEDQQLSAIGGAANLVQLVNADEGTGIGFDLDGEFLITDSFVVTAGLSYNDTELDDPNLTVAPCGSGLCTVLDQLDAGGNAIVDGNQFPQAPDTIVTFTARYGTPIGDNGEFFVFTDWAFQGETHFFLYESEEFVADDNFEGGLRIGYAHNGGQYEVALFGRNITDEENLKGGIDFSNITGFVNEPRIWGISFKANFGE